MLLSMFFTACDMPWAKNEEPADEPTASVSVDDSNTSTDDADNPNPGSDVTDPSNVAIPVARPVVVDDYDEAPGKNYQRSELTGQWVKKGIYETRPMAFIIGNEQMGLPQYNIGECEVLYEVPFDNNMSRFIGVTQNWLDKDRIGNIMEIRDYMIDYALEWDPIIVHAKNSISPNDPAINISAPNEINDNDVSANYDTAALFRVLDEGRKYNQTIYAYGKGLSEQMKLLKYTDKANASINGHFSFAMTNAPTVLTNFPGAINADTVDLSLCFTNSRPWLAYNEETGLYERYQYDEAHKDGATYTQLAYKNVILEYVDYKKDDKTGVYTLTTSGEGSGWFITNGAAIPITWKKAYGYDATRYYNDQGDEIIFNPGKTMIEIIKKADSVTIK